MKVWGTGYDLAVALFDRFRSRSGRVFRRSCKLGCASPLADCSPLVASTTKIAMALRTVEQVRRVFRIVAGFTLLAAGAIMLVTPGPGWLTIFLGLGFLAAEFVWARRLMDRIKREGGKLRDAVLGPEKEQPRPDGKQPNPSETP